MPVHKPDAILDNIEQGGIRLIYEAELAYLRGDFKRVMNCYDKTLGDDAVRLRICPIAIAAAILKERMKGGSLVAGLIGFAGVIVAVGVNPDAWSSGQLLGVAAVLLAGIWVWTLRKHRNGEKH